MTADPGKVHHGFDPPNPLEGDQPGTPYWASVVKGQTNTIVNLEVGSAAAAQQLEFKIRNEADTAYETTSDYVDISPKTFSSAKTSLTITGKTFSESTIKEIPIYLVDKNTGAVKEKLHVMVLPQRNVEMAVYAVQDPNSNGTKFASSPSVRGSQKGKPEGVREARRREARRGHALPITLREARRGHALPITLMLARAHPGATVPGTMARKHRLEFPGAIYHVINRGNYRSWVFKDDGAKTSFERSVLEAGVKYGWVLHAYVIMGNHYHLAVETPEGDLVAGMQWLQACFANRFNRLRQERGHVFQGRYKALLVEPGEALGQLCHYIHLNPVRARIVGVARLGSYRPGSYWYLTRKRQRPHCLRLTTALEGAGGLADTPAGHRSYAQYLAWQSAQGPAGKNRAYESMSRGWALGSGAYKRELIREHHLARLDRAWDGAAMREIRAARWQEALGTAVSALPAAVRKDRRKCAPWKVAVASHLKASTGVPNGWLAEQLDMGSGTYVSKHVGLARRRGGDGARLAAIIAAKEKGKA